MTKPRTVLTLGYAALDVIRHGRSISHAAGGTAVNVAANLRHLGWTAAFAGRLGDDAAGRRVAHDLRALEVDLTLGVFDPDVETPVVLHEVEPPRHRFSFSCPQCGRAFPKHRPLPREHVDRLLLPRLATRGRPEVVFFDRASAASIALAAQLRSQGSLVVFEPSARGDAARTDAAKRTAHVIKLSAERRAGLRDGILNPVDGQWQIVTSGPDGLAFRCGDGPWTDVPGYGVRDVDSAGAGDWLTARLLDALGASAFRQPADPATAETMRRAQAMAALSCGYVGARTLGRLPRELTQAFEQQLRDGCLTVLPRPPRPRRSRAVGVCRLCLGRSATSDPSR
jgi:sugar/nucleoside kinase (ribokinase family)